MLRGKSYPPDRVMKESSPSNLRSILHPGWVFFLTASGISILISLLLAGLYIRTSFLYIDTDLTQGTVFQIFYDQGEGFSEKDSRRYTPDRSEFRRRILLPGKIKALRIDPANNDQPVRFRKLLFKPNGQIRSIDLLSVGGIQLHEIGAFGRDGLLRPIAGSTDPYFVIPGENLGNGKGFDWDGFSLTCIAVTGVLWVILFVMRLIVLLFAIGYQRLLTASHRWYGNERFEVWRQLRLAGCLTIGLITALALNVFYADTLANRYTVSFELTSTQSDSVGLYFDQGYGFNGQDLVYREAKTTEDKEIYHLHFEIPGDLRRIRIDPGNHAGTFVLENIRIRKGMGDWHSLDLRNWIGKRGTQLEQDSGRLKMDCNEDDPYVRSDLLNIDFDASGLSFHLVVQFFAGFLSVTSLLLLFNFLRFYRIRRAESVSLQSTGKSRFRRFLLKMVRGRVTLGVLYLLMFGVFFAGYFPGGLCGDTIADIHAALKGVVGSNDPALLQIGVRLLHHVAVSQWPMLFIQLSLYFSGFYLISLYFLKRQKSGFAYLTLLLSIFPHLLYMHTLVVKDVLVGALWLNAVGIVLLTWDHPFRLLVVVARSVAALLVLVSVLCRDNTFLAAPALLMMLISPERFRGRNRLVFVKYVTASAVFLIPCFEFMQFINGQLNTERGNRDYNNDFFVSQICATDLIGMSIRSEHRGVTARLNPEEKRQLEDLYYKRPIFWLERNLYRKMFPEKVDVLNDWKEEVLNHPLVYLRHRVWIFTHLFAGSPDLQMMWVSQSKNLEWVQSRLEVNRDVAKKFVVPDGWEGNPIYHGSWFVFKYYFATVSDTIVVLLVVFCTAVWIRTLLRAVKRCEIPPVEWIVFHSILAGACYTVPDFFFVQHSETRYVYPALILFFISLLVVVENGINRREDFGVRT